MSLRTKAIPDHNLRAAATLIDRALGKKNDDEVTAADLEKAQELVAQKAAGGFVKELTPLQLDLIEKALPELQKLVAMDPKKPSLAPFATGVWTPAIADVKVRACAAAIAKALSSPNGAPGGDDKLELGKFLDARDALRGTPPKAGREAAVNDAKSKLKDAIASGVINEDTISALDTFFLNGDVGGIMSHGPVKISGIAYDDVYRLPLSSPNEAKNGPDYGAAIADYEKRFANVAQDRIYIKGKEGELYVALHPKGKVEHVDENYQVSMRDETNQSASGKGLKVVDIANSFGEATWRPWVEGLVHAADLITSGFKKIGDTAIDKAVGRASDAILEGADGKAAKDRATDMKSMAMALFTTGTMGAAAFNLPVVLGALIVGGVAVTGASVLSWLQKSEDLAPIFHAMGVTVNVTDAVRA